jgi:RNA recognition motif-containing protein
MKLCSVWVARRPPGYAFVEFDDRRDALDAVQSLDGQYEASVIFCYLIILVCIEVDGQKYSIMLLN